MNWLESRRFRLLLRVFQFRSMRPDLDSEVDAEIGYHLDRTRAELERRGLGPEAARREAERRFGDLGAHRRRILHFHRKRGRRERMIALLEAAKDSFRESIRSLRSDPGVTFIVTLTLAIGIGANATMFGIVDRLLLRPPDHIRDPDGVVRIFVERTFLDRLSTGSGTTYPDIADWMRADAFASVAAISNIWGDHNMTVGHGEGALQVMAQQASPSFFTLLGVQPLHGRFYGEAEDVAGAADLAVLGHDFWRRQYGGDPGVLGEEVVLAGSPHRIIGVAPPGFTGVELTRIDVWTPLRSSATPVGDPDNWEGSRGYYWLRAIARLAPGATAAVAEAEATALHRAGRAEDTRYDPEARVRLGSVIAARGFNPTAESRVAAWLAAVAAIVLLIACANVANLLLARGTRRRREIGVRLALGISTRRLFAQQLLETVLLASLGGAAGLLVAWQGGNLVRALLLPDVHWVESPLGLRLLGFTFAASVVTGLVAGLGPAWTAVRQNVVDVLGGPSTRGAGAAGGRFRAGMLVLQTTLSVLLLVGAGLFVKSLSSAQSVDLGFDPDGLLLASPEFDNDAFGPERRRPFFAEVAQRLEGLPGVRGVALTESIPFYSRLMIQVSAPDVVEPPTISTGGPYVVAVDPGYFATMGIRIVEGRGFGAADDAGAPGVVVLNETMARAYWPDGDAIGKCLLVGGDQPPCSTVVGIAENAAQSLQPSEHAEYYVLLDQQPSVRPNALFLRTNVASADLARSVRAAIEGTDPAVRYADVQPLRNLIDPQTRSWRLGASMFTVFGALALVIAAVGLYGVMAFNVAQRSHEIGVRSALGAEPRRLIGLVVAQALWVVGASLVAGTLLALLAGRWVEPLLYGVRPGDPAVLGGVAAALLAIAAIAATVPARRAVRVDPAVALRVE